MIEGERCVVLDATGSFVDYVAGSYGDIIFISVTYQCGGRVVRALVDAMGLAAGPSASQAE